MTLLLLFVFIAGYAAIAFEHLIHINKAAIALIAGILCWVILMLYIPATEETAGHLTHQMADISGILFFLMGAMAIVELIDTSNGFDIITAKIVYTNKRKLLWTLALVTFFLSPILDNLTTTIVMVLLIRKLIADINDRLMFASTIVIAANAGGVWSPIGDVTTTMLWIGGQVTVPNISFQLFLPSITCLLVPLTILSLQMRGVVSRPADTLQNNGISSRTHQYIVLFTGIFMLFLVPVFKTVTNLPPYMGILFGLGILWIITEIIRRNNNYDRRVLSVAYALQKIDTPSILFFLGILLCVAALQTAGVLASIANVLDNSKFSDTILVIIIGIASSIIDNVPLVAAMQKMYSLDRYPPDHFFWTFLAYCTGTGGSLLIIGSAAGVTAMGMEKIKFFWYTKKISFLTLLGYLAGAGVFLLQALWL